MAVDRTSYEPFPAFSDWDVGFDPGVVDAYRERLQAARAVATPEARQRAFTVATRYAAVDTGAIEGLYTTDRGFTKTIATQSEFWERALAMKGERVRRSIEDALAGYEYVLDAVTGATPITPKWIRELHAVITEHQETYTVHVPVGGELHEDRRPLPHGEYKQSPNNPTTSSGRVHHYAPPEDTASELARLTDELASPAFAGAHPVVQAAYAHYAYICVHPFADGNGRVARALASVFLYRAPGVPLVIFADQRDAYLDALVLADSGRPDGFVDFVAERVIDTVNLVIRTLGATHPSAAAQAAETARLWTDDGLDLAARRLRQQCLSQLRSELASLALPDRLEAKVDASSADPFLPALPPGYQLASPDSAITLSARSDPESPDRRHSLSFLTAVGSVDRAPELLMVPDAEFPTLDVWRREIDPAMTTALRIRLDAWAKNVLAFFIQGLNGALRESAEHPPGLPREDLNLQPAD